MDFSCNICGKANSGVEESGREGTPCAGCGASMRHRSLMAVLCQELFGVAYSLHRLPALKSIRGLGLSDSDPYAVVLADRFQYRNTYLHRDPVLDIADPGPQEAAALDFLLASEVFEHVRPPVERAFQKVAAMLRPDGMLVMTVPYELEGATREHFPELEDFAAVVLRSGPALVNRTADGQLQLFSDLVFHGGRGSTLELRCFSEAGLRAALADAGFGYVRIHAEDYPEFGIVHREKWSLPVAARRRAPETNRALICELLERNWSEWYRPLREENARLHAELMSRTEWTKSLESRMNAEIGERTAWARDLEAQIQERTAWAQRVDQERKTLEEHLSRTRSSLWYRLGRRLGLIA
ncbi:MAG TPA: methyltransferase domain-containing protein [Bryobacteraceae bacterium]|nr:methyltransferase domain-containing protein [Bryobacteraceae bacterium]